MALDKIGGIISSAGKIFSFATEIAKIIGEKGPEEAGKMKLSDIPGFQEWSQSLLEEDADGHFADKLEELKEKLNNE